MKLVVKFILSLLFIPAILIGVLSVNVKYQLLMPLFWQKTFDNGNVYVNLSRVLRTYTEGQIVEKGGKVSEAEVLTDLITPVNVKDFLDKNLVNILSYANGKTGDIIVYIPISKLPGGFIPNNLSIGEQTPLVNFLSKFNISITRDQIKWISLIGRTSNYSLIISLSVLAATLFLFVFLNDPGKRFIFAGIVTFFTGLILIAIWKLATTFGSSLTTNLYGSSSFNNQIVAIVAPPLLAEIAKIWLWAGIILVILGGLFFIFKKSGESGVKSIV